MMEQEGVVYGHYVYGPDLELREGWYEREPPGSIFNHPVILKRRTDSLKKFPVAREEISKRDTPRETERSLLFGGKVKTTTI